MNTLNNQNEINVGVDTGKTQLDIYIRPLDIYFTVENNQSGIKHAIQILKKHPVTRVTIEATGWTKGVKSWLQTSNLLNQRGQILTSDIKFIDWPVILILPIRQSLKQQDKSVIPYF